MASTFGGLEAAKSGLSVSMQQLNVTEQNIANVNTAGYTRQRLITSAKEPASSKYLIAQLDNALIGQGVETIGVRQIRSEYLDLQFRNLHSRYNYSAYRSEGLTYLDGVFNELDEDSSLTKTIDKFFSALNTFSSDTSSAEYRTNVQQQALGMTESFNNIYEQMESLWNDQNGSISTTAQKINSISEKLAQLNDAIASAVQSGGSANDLNDERNLLLDELSGYVNITYSVNADNENMIDVQIGEATLVSGEIANEIMIDSPSNHIEDIDDLTSQIAEINRRIADDEISAEQGKDDIELLVLQLQEYVDVDMDENADDAELFDISFNGVSLVTGTKSIGIESAAASSVSAWVGLNSNNLTLNSVKLSIAEGNITGGKLYANMEMVENESSVNPGIPYYMVQLNNLVKDMATSINAIHQKGYTYPDSTSGSASKNDVIFFDVPPMLNEDGTVMTDADGYTIYDYSKLNAGNFTLSDDVLNSVNNIAGSSQVVELNTGSTETGNNLIALELFGDLANSGYYDKLNSIVGHLAIASDTTNSIMDTRESLLESVDTQRASISGVSLDEETTNLIVFQQSYNACARVITTLDQMLDTMINNMGVVGR
jgi:flagellar hook-associated protein 1 FlgK